MSVRRCEYCARHIEWLKIIDGRRLPFDHPPIVVSELAETEEPWVPGRRPVGKGKALVTVMVKLSECSSRIRNDARFVFLVHSCEGFRKAQAIRQRAQRDTEATGDPPAYSTTTRRSPA